MRTGYAPRCDNYNAFRTPAALISSLLQFVSASLLADVNMQINNMYPTWENKHGSYWLESKNDSSRPAKARVPSMNERHSMTTLDF